MSKGIPLALFHYTTIFIICQYYLIYNHRKRKKEKENKQHKRNKIKRKKKRKPLKRNFFTVAERRNKSPRLPAQFPTDLVWLSTPSKNPSIKTK